MTAAKRFACALFVAAGLCGAARAADASLLTYAGADREARIVAAARQEGSLTLYTTFAEKDLPAIVGPFERKYGVKVHVWRAGTNAIMQRALREAQAKRYEVDAIHFGSPEMEALHREGILQPVASPHAASLVPGSVPPHREWTATLLTVWVIAYNTRLVRRDELPLAWQDLLDPRWKGRLGVEAKDQDWFAAVVLGMGEARGLQFFRDLIARNGVSARQGHSLLNNLVASGEVPMALNMYNYMPEQAKLRGAPIDWFAIEPAPARSNAIGIARRAPRPNAALLFHDYFITEAQAALAAMGYLPASRAVASPLRSLRLVLVDPEATVEETDKWTRMYESIVTRRGGA